MPIELLIVLAAVYFTSALIVGAVHWARHRDTMTKGISVSAEEKVINLYVMPLTPIVNTATLLGILTNLFN